jgi:hypothetical protein
MQQHCTYGSVRGATGDCRPYRDDTQFVHADVQDGLALRAVDHVDRKDSVCKER